MITSKDCLEKYGNPVLERNMFLLRVPKEYRINSDLPARIYMNEDIKEPFLKALETLKNQNALHLIKSWDGCFNIRNKKGQKDSFSLHSWGLAFDINTDTNGWGKVPEMPYIVVMAFKDAGFDWGGDWTVKDGMHFQLKKYLI